MTKRNIATVFLGIALTVFTMSQHLRPVAELINGVTGLDTIAAWVFIEWLLFLTMGFAVAAISKPTRFYLLPIIAAGSIISGTIILKIPFIASILNLARMLLLFLLPFFVFGGFGYYVSKRVKAYKGRI